MSWPIEFEVEGIVSGYIRLVQDMKTIRSGETSYTIKALKGLFKPREGCELKIGESFEVKDEKFRGILIVDEKVADILTVKTVGTFNVAGRLDSLPV